MSDTLQQRMIRLACRAAASSPDDDRPHVFLKLLEEKGFTVVPIGGGEKDGKGKDGDGGIAALDRLRYESRYFQLVVKAATGCGDAAIAEMVAHANRQQGEAP